MQRPVLTPLRAFLLSAGPAVVAGAMMPLTGSSLDRTIGVVGATFAIGSFAVQQFQARATPERRVIFLAKSRSSFAACIVRGVREQLADIGAVTVSQVNPTPAIDDVLRWQIGELRSAAVRDAHGLVIIPAADDVQLWHELATVVRRGTFVVTVDIKPPNQIFTDLGLSRPTFVGSDFAEGGDDAGHLLVAALNADERTRAVVALGPDSSWPAKERVSWILYRLASAGVAHRCNHVALDNWDEVEGVNKLLPLIRQELEAGTPTVVVFCANDKIAHALWITMGRELSNTQRNKVRLLGYDGTTSEDGSYVLTNCAGVYATVDALPLQQGRVAGELLADAFHGKAAVAATRHIRPRTVVMEPLIDGSPRTDAASDAQSTRPARSTSASSEVKPR